MASTLIMDSILMSRCSVDEKSLSSWDIRDENLALSRFDVGSDLVKFEFLNQCKNLG